VDEDVNGTLKEVTDVALLEEALLRGYVVGHVDEDGDEALISFDGPLNGKLNWMFSGKQPGIEQAVELVAYHTRQDNAS